MIKYVLIGLLLLSSNVAYSGQIRTINMNSKKMKDVHLRMGQSTIIRFRDKPKKVVVGNQNYYSVEFIGNDVTIQPLAKFSTNLFVYTDFHVYGFLLKTSQYGRYDDLVNVRWKAQGLVLEQRKRPKPFREKSLNIKLDSKILTIRIREVTANKSRGSHIFDFTATNKSLEKIKTSEIKVFLTRSNKELLNQEFAFEKDDLRVDETIRGRVLVRLKEKKAFTFNISYKKEKMKVIISRRVL